MAAGTDSTPPERGKLMAKHKLRINVTDDAPDDSLVSARTVSLRERLLTRILGRKQRVTVLVPGR